MKRSNRLVLVLGPLMAVVVFGANVAVGATRGTVDELSGVGSLIQAGDRADVMLSPTQADRSFPVALDDPMDGTSDGSADPVMAIDDLTDPTMVTVLAQNVQVLATTLPAAATPGRPTNPDTGQPIIDERLAPLGVTPQQAELIRFAQLDGNLSLLLRSPQDAASADVTTAGVTQPSLVDEHGILPPRVVLSKFP